MMEEMESGGDVAMEDREKYGDALIGKMAEAYLGAAVGCLLSCDENQQEEIFDIYVSRREQVDFVHCDLEGSDLYFVKTLERIGRSDLVDKFMEMQDGS